MQISSKNAANTQWDCHQNPKYVSIIDYNYTPKLQLRTHERQGQFPNLDVTDLVGIT